MSEAVPPEGSARVPQSRWLTAIRVYLAVTVAGHLVWEALQLPLYTIWRTGTAQELGFAVAHCTGGDVLIALTCLMGALVLAGRGEWPLEAFGRVAVLAILLGVAYTGFSEWLNVVVRQSWAYSEHMPVSPLLGFKIGLSPLLQWVVVPATAFASTRRIGRTTR